MGPLPNTRRRVAYAGDSARGEGLLKQSRAGAKSASLTKRGLSRRATVGWSRLTLASSEHGSAVRMVDSWSGSRLRRPARESPCCGGRRAVDSSSNWGSEGCSEAPVARRSNRQRASCWTPFGDRLGSSLRVSQPGRDDRAGGPASGDACQGVITVPRRSARASIAGQ